MSRRRGHSPASEGPRLRHRLSVRVLTSYILVTICSVTATAWVAVQGTSGAIRTEQGQTLADDTRIYDALLGYAATHPDWEGVDGLVGDLAAETGRRITLTTQDRVLVVDSDPDAPAPRGRASSVVDPMAVDVTLVPDSAPDRIDARAVGPFALPEAERTELLGLARTQAECFGNDGWEMEVDVGPSGRPALRPASGASEPSSDHYCWWIEEDPYFAFPSPASTGAPGPVPPAEPTPAPDSGSASLLNTPTGTEEAALAELGELASACALERDAEHRPPVLGDVFALTGPSDSAMSDPSGRPADGVCVEAARHELLAPYTASAVLLFISDPTDGAAESGLALSREGLVRIIGLVAVVLALAVGASVLLSTRLTRPLRTLTDAVQRVRAGQDPAGVRVSDRGEIGRLAQAFNDMSRHLGDLERQRKDMISDISHELRTPLANIRSWLEAAQDGLADLDHERRATLIGEALLLQRLIDDLQDLAQADAGELRLHPEPVDLRDIVAQVVEGHRTGAGAAGIDLTGRVEGDLVLTADPARLRQAVGNLVSNALRHTPEGGRVTVRAFQRGDLAAIEVEDTGEGIAPEHLPRLFDRFWRADKSRSRRTGGSGLGLAIVRHIAELHGGHALAVSTPGAGSAFTIVLPSAPQDT
ncbi:sensor histidine kinase [Actinorugispora endophytica]|uniref:histidine kinase n=1 Tax=Actinorugispora endophytica TaxID=1605990 RepID=A0A4R6V559_9ACTN|nr:HAMP domain-containing sensor histidine kinase [Actinorugispora endophytica]TDQ53437.1 two-component system sensor histidine kinase BaeS [Actinorugispora endophytica]